MTESDVQRQPTSATAAAPVVDQATAGLTQIEAERRLAQHGANALAEHHISALERLLRFFWGPIPWMIEIAAILSAVLGHWDDLSIILLMLFINAGSASGRSSKLTTRSHC